MKIKTRFEKKLFHFSAMAISKFAIIFLIAFCLMATACADVKPWQKGHLAKKQMAFDPDPAETKYIQHMYTSKEAASGGYGIGGGGCGCN